MNFSKLIKVILLLIQFNYINKQFVVSAIPLLNNSNVFEIPTTKTSYENYQQTHRIAKWISGSKRMNPVEHNNHDDSQFTFLVVGGYRPDPNPLAKYVISLRYDIDGEFGTFHTCGGSIITKKVILTAAHCISTKTRVNPAHFFITVAGTPRRLLRTQHTQVVEVDKVKAHPKYNPTPPTYDIAVLKLKKELDLDDDFVSIIPIADQKPSAGQQCTVIGWGDIVEYGPNPDEIVSGDIVIHSEEYCKERLAQLWSEFTTVCASNPKTSSCFGDSGGPLICDKKLVGIVSYGTRCGHPNSPVVYTNVYYFRDWILRNSVCCLTKPFSFFYNLELIALTLFLTY